MFDPLYDYCMQARFILVKYFIVVYTLGHKSESTKTLFYRCTCPYLGPAIPEGHAARVTLLPGSFWMAPSSFFCKVAWPQTEDYCTLEHGCHTVQGDMCYADVASVE